MLNCVYHPIDKMRVVDNAEREKLLASGVWFDSPLDAKNYRLKVEQEVKEEPLAKKQKAKTEEKL